MKRTMKKLLAFLLVLSLAFGINYIPVNAKAIKGVVAPLTVWTPSDGGLMGRTSVSCWNKSGNFSSDFSSYTVSADVYLPFSMFGKDDGSVFIDPQVQFWFEDLGTNGILDNEKTIRLGFDYERNVPFFLGIIKNTGEETDDVPFIKDVKKIGDMVKVEIVDAPVIPVLKTTIWDKETGSEKAWTDPVPTKGDAVVQICVSKDRPIKTKFAVTNASIKIGDKEYKTDYNKSGYISSYSGEKEGYNELKAQSFNTSSISVAKTSVSVKKAKTATVKVTTMFSGDKVKVSSSSAKVATATYKSGKLTITGVKKGTATISVKANGKTKKINVTVK